MSMRPPHKVSVTCAENEAEFLSIAGGAAATGHDLVVKSHYADAGMLGYVAANGAKCVLTVRDPRDCIVSTMERFNESFDQTFVNVKASCDAMMRFMELDALLFRYEDGFAQSPQVLARLKNHLVPEVEVDLAEIAQMHSKESIKQFIGSFDQMEPGRLGKIGGDMFDSVTHWHSNHFGDGMSNKWRTRLTAEQQEFANRMLATPLARFGYSAYAYAMPWGEELDTEAV